MTSLVIFWSCGIIEFFNSGKKDLFRLCAIFNEIFLLVRASKSHPCVISTQYTFSEQKFSGKDYEIVLGNGCFLLNFLKNSWKFFGNARVYDGCTSHLFHLVSRIIL